MSGKLGGISVVILGLLLTPTITSCESARTATTLTTTPGDPGHPTNPPTVSRALEIRAYADKPCELIPPEKQKEFGFVRSSDRLSVNLDKNCLYSSSEPGAISDGVTVEFNVDRSYFRIPYNPQNTNFVRFREFSILGQPAVDYADQGDQANCTIAVALSDNAGFQAKYRGTPKGRPVDQRCPMAIAVAETVIRTLGG